MRLQPDLRIDRVEELTPAVLARHGVDGLLLDLDETVVPASSVRPAVAVRRWAAALAMAGVRVVIVSNGTPRRVAIASRALGVPGLALVCKPWPFAYRRGLATLGLDPARVAMVGDQLFLDVLGARRAGVRTVLVRPLSHGGMPHTRLLRRLERRLLTGGEHGRPLHR